jgi:hypothetical protein
MTHVRQQLREQMVAEIAVIPDFVDSVSSTRILNLRKEQFPFCNVFAEGEESELRAMGAQGGRILLRTVVLATEVYDIGTAEDIDNTLDGYAAELEKILGNSTLNDLAYDVTLSSTDFSFDADSDNPTGVITLFWSVQYQTTEGDPEVAV